ncbi:MAG: hypothetical protein LWX23_05745 [Spirochaetia bacterium]|jgi:hypothetical protein|uniref:Uncharacterized protein n=1 Tax=bioreactor metagenome TaxID=1076179 RepID=A0A644WHA5_9ZZZZ|nr:hypothetical protein [Spirochaetia bacterium]MCE1208957.1 hypothetical protein [Spirochaetia bacterium]VBB40709.1 conserved hypothetical protein [uncultured Spirochaetota bacterium]HOI23879.1 hypothetical protein [Spirochaetales bacterium]
MILVVLYKLVYLCIAAAIAVNLFKEKSIKMKTTYAIVALPLLLRLFGIK